MILEFLGIIAGLSLLIYGADWFVSGSSNIARLSGMPPLIIGLTVVGIGTSLPEILVGTVAALNYKTEIAIGNAIGSNIANIGLVLGATALSFPVTIKSKTLRWEYWLMTASIVITLVVLLDRSLSRIDSLVLLVILGMFVWQIIRLAKKSPPSDPLTREYEKELAQVTTIGKSSLKLFAGLVFLLGGAELLVRCAVNVAAFFGISDLVIGLTIIAVGTSLPELAASIMSVIKKEADIAIGNVIGSNMFNMLAVISIPGLIHPSGFSSEVLLRDFPVMIGLTLLMGWMVFMHGSGQFRRSEGFVLLLCFVGYQYWLFHS